MTPSFGRVAGRSLLAVATALAMLVGAAPGHAQNDPAATPDGPAPSSAAPGAGSPAPGSTSLPPAGDPRPPATLEPILVAPTPAAAPSTTPAKPAPDPSTGFQMAFRFGLSFPMGDATSAPLDSLGARYAWQVPLALDLGAKLGPSIFVGGYLLFAFGAEGSDALVESLCDDDDDDLENDVSCSSSTVRLGLEVQYHFMPGEKTNVWIGYGAGFESSSQGIRDTQQGYAETTTVSGITLAQLSVGADFRSKLFGVGPYAELALGRFDHSSTEVNSVQTATGDIEDPAWHAWFSLGLRMVLFP